MGLVRRAESWCDEDFEGLAAGHGPVAVGHAVQADGSLPQIAARTTRTIASVGA